jgi:protein ImuB
MTEWRILSVWWPNLAVERWAKASDVAPDAPVILTVEGTHGPIIHAVTKAAAERGARPGARVTDARALDPALIAVPADPEADAALVERLARWAGRWSPLVEVDGDGLRLDVSGVAHLFGGEEGLAADMERRFAGLGLTSRIAIASTAAAAWALARYQPLSPLREREGAAKRRKGEGSWTKRAAPSPRSRSARVDQRSEADRPPDGRSRTLPQRGEGLEALPVAALRLDPETVLTLERLGLKTIGALLAMPRLALARRFKDEAVVDALDRLTGRKAEPLVAAPSERPPRVTLPLEEPATHAEAASQALERLIPGLVGELERRRLGARHLRLTGFRVDGSTAAASVATSIPSREPMHLQRLLADKAAALDPEFGFDGFALEAAWSEPLGAAQTSLVEEVSAESAVAELVDRLAVKLGAEKVRRPQSAESHLPERASGWSPAVSSPAFAGEVASEARRRGPSTAYGGPPPLQMQGRKARPQRLLDRPEAIDVIYATPEGMPRRFVWRRAVHDIARVEGPERIAPEWWRQPSTSRLRDYYRVEDQAGRRYWIYREGLAGDGRGGAPGWYLHGLFG